MKRTEILLIIIVSIMIIIVSCLLVIDFLKFEASYKHISLEPNTQYAVTVKTTKPGVTANVYYNYRRYLGVDKFGLKEWSSDLICSGPPLPEKTVIGFDPWWRCSLGQSDNFSDLNTIINTDNAKEPEITIIAAPDGWTYSISKIQ